MCPSNSRSLTTFEVEAGQYALNPVSLISLATLFRGQICRTGSTHRLGTLPKSQFPRRLTTPGSKVHTACRGRSIANGTCRNSIFFQQLFKIPRDLAPRYRPRDKFVAGNLSGQPFAINSWLLRAITINPTPSRAIFMELNDGGRNLFPAGI